MGSIQKGYLNTLKDRKKESRVYEQYQFVGLEIAAMLDDLSHKALYIKLAKERDNDTLLGLAKTIGTNLNVRNKGAYFMSQIRAKAPKKQKRLAA